MILVATLQLSHLAPHSTAYLSRIQIKLPLSPLPPSLSLPRCPPTILTPLPRLMRNLPPQEPSLCKALCTASRTAHEKQLTPRTVTAQQQMPGQLHPKAVLKNEKLKIDLTWMLGCRLLQLQQLLQLPRQPLRLRQKLQQRMPQKQL